MGKVAHSNAEHPQMEVATKAAWAALALIHLSPAAVLVNPKLIAKLYGVESGGDLSVLLTHRGALFLGIVAGCVWALIDPPARRALSIVVAISVIGFLVVYWRAGLPPGALRTVALVDVVALVPLAFVVFAAWRGQVA
jgi:hypothetical protein